MTDPRRLSPDNHEQYAERRLLRLLHWGAAVALAAAALAAAIAVVHAELASHESGYTSFCNISASINCDRVLGSPFATLFGLPLAWYALLAYLVIAACFHLASRAEAAQRRLFLLAAGLGVLGAAAFSLYMAFVSLLILKTVCLMCSGLYLAAAFLCFTVFAARSRFSEAYPSTPPLLPTRQLAAAASGLALAVGGLGLLTWPSVEAMPAELVSLADLRQANLEFYDWYTKLPVARVPAGGQAIMGSPAAPVTIVEFSDFQCAYCRRNHKMLKDLLTRRPGQVRVVYRHFPLDASCNEAVPHSLHRWACRAAEAAECAGRQGHFSDMADALFEHQRQLFESNLFRLASTVGLVMSTFEHCMTEHSTLPAITEDCRAGQQLSITSTPTLFINGRKVVGAFEKPSRYDYAVLIEDRQASRE